MHFLTRQYHHNHQIATNCLWNKLKLNGLAQKKLEGQVSFEKKDLIVKN